MTRSAFLQSLVAVLAGTHAAGPAWPGTLSEAVRRCVAQCRPAEPTRDGAAPVASCR